MMLVLLHVIDRIMSQFFCLLCLLHDTRKVDIRMAVVLKAMVSYIHHITMAGNVMIDIVYLSLFKFVIQVGFMLN